MYLNLPISIFNFFLGGGGNQLILRGLTKLLGGRQKGKPVWGTWRRPGPTGRRDGQIEWFEWAGRAGRVGQGEWVSVPAVLPFLSTPAPSCQPPSN